MDELNAIMAAWTPPEGVTTAPCTFRAYPDCPALALTGPAGDGLLFLCGPDCDPAGVLEKLDEFAARLLALPAAARMLAATDDFERSVAPTAGRV